MPVQVQQSSKQKRDIFDLLIGGLQAASAYTNIQKARAELKQIPETQARIKRQEERQKQQDTANFASTFQSVPEGTTGAVSLQDPGGEKGLFLPRAQVLQQKKLFDSQQQEQLKTSEAKLEQKNKQETGLRKEWLTNPVTKLTQDVSTAVGKVRATGTGKPSAAGDLSLVFNFMKLLDPGSVVRESEFATARNAAGVPDRVRNVFNQLKSGQMLNPNQRKDFVNRAEQLYNVHWQRQKAFNEAFKDLTKRNKLDSKNVILDLKFSPAKPSLLPRGEDIKILNQNIQRYEKRLQTQPQQQPQQSSFDPDEFLQGP